MCFIVLYKNIAMKFGEKFRLSLELQRERVFKRLDNTLPENLASKYKNWLRITLYGFHRNAISDTHHNTKSRIPIKSKGSNIKLILYARSALPT